MIRVAPSCTAFGLSVLLYGVGACSAFAQSANVVLDNLALPAQDDTTVTIKHVEVTNTNLTRDEVAKLFAPGTTKEEAGAIAAKMKADKFSVPEVVVVNKEATITLHDLLATDINAGKIGHMGMRGIDGAVKAGDGTSGTIKAGALDIQSANLSRMFSVLRGGDIADGGATIGHLTWSGLDISVADKDTPATAPGGNLIKISLASIDAQSTYDGDVPLKGNGTVKNLVIEPPKASQFGQGLNAFGYDKIDLSFTFSGNYDKAKRSYTIDDYTISGVNAGAFGIKAQVGSIDPSIFTAGKDAKLAGVLNADVSNLTVRYGDNGLFQKTVAFVGAMQRKSPDALKKEWSAMATQFIPIVLGGDPASLKIVDAINKFIASPKSLTIGIKAKGAPLKIADLTSLRDPQALLSHIDITAASGQ